MLRTVQQHGFSDNLSSFVPEIERFSLNCSYFLILSCIRCDDTHSLSHLDFTRAILLRLTIFIGAVIERDNCEWPATHQCNTFELDKCHLENLWVNQTRAHVVFKCCQYRKGSNILFGLHHFIVTIYLFKWHGLILIIHIQRYSIYCYCHVITNKVAMTT